MNTFTLRGILMLTTLSMLSAVTATVRAQDYVDQNGNAYYWASNGTIDAGHSGFNSVNVGYDPLTGMDNFSPTVNVVTGGSVPYLTGYGGSTINMNGGNVSVDASFGNYSTFNWSGGSLGVSALSVTML